MMNGLQVAFAVLHFATVTTGVNMRKLNSEGQDLCRNVEGRCCKWNNDTVSVPPVDEGPLVLFSGGCTGSTAVLGMVRDIARMSNRSVHDCGTGYELLADIVSGFYGDDMIVNPAALRAFNKLALDGNRNLLFKAEDRFLGHPQALQWMKSVGAKFAVLTRWNKLDVALCSVRDCFFANFTPTAFGYNTDEKGLRSESCAFRGRGTNETAADGKVWVNTSSLLDNLAYLTSANSEDNNAAFLQHHDVEFQLVDYEDLFAFHSGTTSDLLLSCVAWVGFMAGFGIQAKFDMVFSFLQQSITSFDRPKPHSETIANFDEVKEALKTCGKFDCLKFVKMLRE